MGNQENTTVSVDTELGAVECRKLVFGDYAQLLRSLDKIPKLVADFLYQKEGKTDFNSQEVLAMLPSLAAESLPEVAAIIASATDKDGPFIEKLDLADVIDVTEGILEVNDFDRIVAAIKKLTARRQKAKPVAAATDKSST